MTKTIYQIRNYSRKGPQVQSFHCLFDHVANYEINDQPEYDLLLEFFVREGYKFELISQIFTDVENEGGCKSKHGHEHSLKFLVFHDVLSEGST